MINSKDFNYFNPKLLTSDEILTLQNSWKEYVSQNNQFKGQKIGEGKGIVIT